MNSMCISLINEANKYQSRRNDFNLEAKKKQQRGLMLGFLWEN